MFWCVSQPVIYEMEQRNAKRKSEAGALCSLVVSLNFSHMRKQTDRTPKRKCKSLIIFIYLSK
jgi:hypothetical protein